MPGRMRSRNSTTVTSAPSRRQTEPSSSPITPAPTTISVFGGLASASAPVEETIVFSSISTPGSRATSEPVAMTIALASSVVSSPSSAFDDTLPGAAIRPRPRSQSILFFLNRNATPLTLAATVSSLCFIIAARSSLGGATTTPSGAKPVRRLLEHFGGVEQRLGGNAADVEAGSAERLPLLDHGDLHAELRRADRADIAAGAGADHDEIVSQVWFHSCL